MTVLSLNLCQSIKACFSKRFIDYVNSKQRVVCDGLVDNSFGFQTIYARSNSTIYHISFINL